MDVVQWPAWRYGPDGKSGIFDSEELVPSGWAAHPSEVKTSGNASENDPDNTNRLEGESQEVDTFGWPWDAGRNTADKAKNEQGEWVMLDGVSRPAPKPGFPKLDL